MGRFQIIFAFDGEVTISVESRYEYRANGTCEVWAPENIQGAAAVLNLLGATVKHVHGAEDGTLILDFVTGQRLVIVDSSDKYESYQITRPGETIVV